MRGQGKTWVCPLALSKTTEFQLEVKYTEGKFALRQVNTAPQQVPTRNKCQHATSANEQYKAIVFGKIQVELFGIEFYYLEIGYAR